MHRSKIVGVVRETKLLEFDTYSEKFQGETIHKPGKLTLQNYRWTDRHADSSIPSKTFFSLGHNKILLHNIHVSNCLC